MPTVLGSVSSLDVKRCGYSALRTLPRVLSVGREDGKSRDGPGRAGGGHMEAGLGTALGNTKVWGEMRERRSWEQK